MAQLTIRDLYDLLSQAPRRRDLEQDGIRLVYDGSAVRLSTADHPDTVIARASTCGYVTGTWDVTAYSASLQAGALRVIACPTAPADRRPSAAIAGRTEKCTDCPRCEAARSPPTSSSASTAPTSPAPPGPTSSRWPHSAECRPLAPPSSSATCTLARSQSVTSCRNGDSRRAPKSSPHPPRAANRA